MPMPIKNSKAWRTETAHNNRMKKATIKAARGKRFMGDYSPANQSLASITSCLKRPGTLSIGKGVEA